MTSKYHISKKGVAARCDAKEGNCPLGGEHYESKKEATQAAVSQQIRNLLSPQEPAAPQLTGKAQNVLLDLLDINDDDEALEDLGHHSEVRDAALAFVKDPSKTPGDPKAVMLLLEDLTAIDYDDDEFYATPDAKEEVSTWLAETSNHFRTQERRSPAPSEPDAPTSCNCGFGGTHEPTNPRCRANQLANTPPQPTAEAVDHFESILEVANEEEVLDTGYSLEMRTQAQEFIKDPSKFPENGEELVDFLSKIRYFDSQEEGGLLRIHPSVRRQSDDWVAKLKANFNPPQTIRMPKGSHGPNAGGAWTL